jgi:uncharacterized protein YbjT (DUF2867 family)
MKYIVFGASGLVGSHVVDILESKNADYIAVYRALPTYKKINLAKAIVYPNILDVPNSYMEGRAVISCTGSTLKSAGSTSMFFQVAVSLVKSLSVKAVEAKSISFNVISGATSPIKFLNKIPYVRAKSMLENALYTTPIVSLNIVRPFFLSGDRKEVRQGEKIILFCFKVISFLLKGKLLTYKPVPAEKVAKSLLYMADQNKVAINIMENIDIHNIDS